MNYSTIVRDGSGRDDALKRRNSAMREALGMAPSPKREPETEKPAAPKADKKPSE